MKKAEFMEIVTAEAEAALCTCPDFESPIEALTQVMDKLEAGVRRQVGDALEAEGRNRYTGKEMRETINENESYCKNLQPGKRDSTR